MDALDALDAMGDFDVDAMAAEARARPDFAEREAVDEEPAMASLEDLDALGDDDIAAALQSSQQEAGLSAAGAADFEAVGGLSRRAPCQCCRCAAGSIRAS